MKNEPGILQRLGAAWHVVKSGNLASVVAHFNRIGGGKKDRPGKPYRQVPAVRACVERTANALASMPIMISTMNDRIVESGPLYDLIDRPNPRMSSSDFVKTSVAWLRLSGACHWVFTQMVGNRPTEITPISAWQMKPILDRHSGGVELAGWKYRPAGSRWDQAIELSLDEVWTIAHDSFDPDDPFGYSSPLETGNSAISQLFMSDLANLASLDNGVEPGGAFVFPGVPDQKVIDGTKDELREREGVRNRRRHMILYGGMDWKQIASNFQDMEFSTLQKMKVVDICAVLDVDPAVVGYVEGGRYEFVKQAKASFWIDTVIPLGCWIADEFDRGVVRRHETDRSLTFRDAIRDTCKNGREVERGQRCTRGYRQATGSTKRTLFVWFDSSRIPAIREAQLQRSKEGAIWIEQYKATPADVIEALDLPLEVHEHQRFAWQKLGEMMIGDDLPGSDDPPVPPEAQENEDTPEAQGDDPAADDNEGEGEKEQEKSSKTRDWSADPVLKELSEDTLARIWAAWRQSWQPIEKSMRSKVTRHFYELREQVLANLANNEALKAAPLADVKRDVIGEVIFDIVAANQKLIVKARPLIRAATQLGGQQSIDEAAIAAGVDPKETDPSNIDDQASIDAMRQRELRLTGINRTLRDQLSKTLADGIAAQETVVEMAERVKTQFNLAKSRANTIAMTETGAAVEQGRQVGRDQAGTPFKSWLSSRKAEPRDWHLEAEIQTFEVPVPNAGLFTLPKTGAQTPHPRGSGLSAEDAANCGCTTLARYPGDQVKDLRMVKFYKSLDFLTHQQCAKRIESTSGDQS